jgi:hypothetical protein
VTLAFWCQIYPQATDLDASALALDAVRTTCAPEVASLMFACQALRVISMQGARQPERTAPTAERVMTAIDGWLT